MTLALPTQGAGPSRAPGEPSFVGAVVRSAVRRLLSTLGLVIVSLGILVGLWAAAVKGLHLDSFGTKTPTQVWRYWSTGPKAPERRSEIMTALWTTLEHASVGYVVGTGLGIALAMVFVAYPRSERVTMPIIMFIKTIPILAVLPLFILAFGRGTMVTVVITTLAVFFPTIIWVSQGLRSPMPTTFDYFRSCSASTPSVLFKLRVPSAVPSLFVAARMSVPGAMFGAVVSEWLATGDGLGYLMVSAMSGNGGYARLWTTVVVTTLVTLLAYVVVETIESLALAHYSPERLLTSGQ